MGEGVCVLSLCVCPFIETPECQIGNYIFATPSEPSPARARNESLERGCGITWPIVAPHLCPRLAWPTAASAAGGYLILSIYAPEGCQHGTHTNGTAYTRGTYSRVHTQTQTNAQRGPTKYGAGSRRGAALLIRGGRLAPTPSELHLCRDLPRRSYVHRHREAPNCI